MALNTTYGMAFELRPASVNQGSRRSTQSAGNKCPDLQAVEAWQPEVQQQHVRRLFQRQLQRKSAITRFIDVPAGTGQHGDDFGL